MAILPNWHSCSMWNKVGWLNWFWQLLWKGLYWFNPKGFCYSYKWSCTLFEERISVCKGLISKKLCKFLFMTVFTYSVSYFFFFYQLPFSSLFTIFNAVSSNTDEVLLINTSATAFVYHKNLLIYFGWSDRPGQLCCHFSISNYFIQIVNFPSWFPDCGLHNPAFYLFLSSDNSIYSTMASPPMGNSIVLLSWFPLSFCYIQKGMTRFIALLM